MVGDSDEPLSLRFVLEFTDDVFCFILAEICVWLVVLFLFVLPDHRSVDSLRLIPDVLCCDLFDLVFTSEDER